MHNLLQALFLLLFSISSLAQSSDDLVKMANKAYDAGKKDDAKALYLKAAAMNNADAHYALAYKYVLTPAESIYHYSEAAKMGHADAVASVIEELFLRSCSLTETNPQLAYDIYLQAKKSNPNLEIFDEQDKIEALKECIEADPFDGDAFIKKYNITKDDTEGDGYSIWELAIEASKGGRFGPPNPKLVLQLVCRGSNVPAELESAVQDAYQNWKNNKVTPFNPCNYVTSGMGLAYCSGKTSAAVENENTKRLTKMAPQLRNNSGPLLQDAYNAADEFIGEKADREEGHDGTGYIAWTNESADKQKAAYLDLVVKINKGFFPKLDKTKDYDKILNDTYKKIIDDLKQKPIKGGFFSITNEDVRKVQLLWIKHRDTSAHLFAVINPAVTEQEWKDYLTKIRIAELNEIPQLRQ